MGALPIASHELGQRLMRVNIAYTTARMKVIEGRPATRLAWNSRPSTA
jgi:hypothetical protein